MGSTYLYAYSILTEVSDVLLHPLQSHDLVLYAVVAAHSALFLGELGSGQEAEYVQAVAHLYHYYSVASPS